MQVLQHCIIVNPTLEFSRLCSTAGAYCMGGHFCAGSVLGLNAKWPARLPSGQLGYQYGKLARASKRLKRQVWVGGLFSPSSSFPVGLAWPCPALPWPGSSYPFPLTPQKPLHVIPRVLSPSSPEAVTCDISFSFTRTPKHTLHDDKGHSNQHS